MVILNLGARHCAFTFDEDYVMAHNGVQMLNAKSLAPWVGKISRVVTWFSFMIVDSAYGWLIITVQVENVTVCEEFVGKA
jgi:hypothetical protein